MTLSLVGLRTSPPQRRNATGSNEDRRNTLIPGAVHRDYEAAEPGPLSALILIRSMMERYPTVDSTYRSIPRSPHVPVHGRHAIHLGRFSLILGQIVGQAELLIFLILGWGTNKDLPVSRVRVDVVVFPHSVAPASLYLAGAS